MAVSMLAIADPRRELEADGRLAGRRYRRDPQQAARELGLRVSLVSQGDIDRLADSDGAVRLKDGSGVCVQRWGVQGDPEGATLYLHSGLSAAQQRDTLALLLGAAHSRGWGLWGAELWANSFLTVLMLEVPKSERQAKGATRVVPTLRPRPAPSPRRVTHTRAYTPRLLGQQYACDPWRLARDLDVEVRVVPASDIEGAYGRLSWQANGAPLIRLRFGQDPAGYRCTLAHELAHLLRPELSEDGCDKWAGVFLSLDR